MNEQKNMQSFQPLQNLPISVFAVSLCLNFSMIELTSNCSYVHVQKGERYERKNMQKFPTSLKLTLNVVAAPHCFKFSMIVLRH
jgi:hypothetical protein